MVDLSLIIPCYNEENILLESVSEIETILNNSSLTYEIIFIDDKSKDNTRELIEELCKEKKYRFIFHAKNKGRGGSVKDGIKSAKGKVVGYIDIDLEVSALYIPYLVLLILDNKADAATGRRIYKESFSSIHRSVLSKGYSLLIKHVLKIPYSDTETGYKFFNRRKVMPIIELTKNNGWFFDTEIMAYLFKKNLRVIEVPVLFIRRTDKKSSVNIVKDVWDYLQNLYNFKKKFDKF